MNLQRAFILNDHKLKANLWQKKLENDFDVVEVFGRPALAIDYLLKFGRPIPTLWIIDHYYYGKKISKKEISDITKLKSSKDILVGSSVSSMKYSFLDLDIGQFPRSIYYILSELDKKNSPNYRLIKIVKNGLSKWLI